MGKLFMLMTSMAFWCYTSYGQAAYTLSGSVMDENHQPLVGAAVYLNPIQKGSVCDDQGQFSIDDLRPGTYVIKISFVGYNTLIDSVYISEDLHRNFSLEEATLNLQEVMVNDHYSEIRKKEESLNIEVVNEEYLKQNMGGSLMKSLERLPGVTTIDIGSGQSKPVIRGLSFNRVVVVENNIKHEAQQWGADHGLEIDQYAVENVEVIKGPASLMYGSDAIGGIIDMKNRRVPVEGTLGGSVDLSGKSNNDLLGASLALYGRKKHVFFTARATILDYGDYKVPTDSVDIYSYKAALYHNYLRNTAGEEQNFHLSLGAVYDAFQSRFYMSSVRSKSGFFANAHGLEPRSVDTDLYDKSNRDILLPFQESRHFKLSNSSYFEWGKFFIETDVGFQRNLREEWSDYVQHGYMPASFPDTLGFDAELERQFDKAVYTANVKLRYQFDETTWFNFGFNGEHQKNAIDGRGFIIPAYRQYSVGAFALGKHQFSEQSLLQVGLRYDYGHLETSAYSDWFTSPVVENGDTVQQYLQRADEIDRQFSNFTWSIGYNYNPGAWSYKINVGKSFRMPIAKELAANGVNYHRFSYEVGNADLSPEIAYQLDAGIEYMAKDFAMGISPFFNYFSNYIYLNPTAEHDRLYGNGNQVYYYTESEVLRYGGEWHAHYELLPTLQLGLMAEYVYSLQLSGAKKGFTLPFSPPASGIINLKYHSLQLKYLKNAYVSLDYRLTAAQNNIVPPEEPTDGYQVFNLAMGGDLDLWKQPMKLSLQVKNVFDTKYFNHTSYYRLINVPEPGRNIIINLSIPF